jgi:hypothetical protein
MTQAERRSAYRSGIRGLLRSDLRTGIECRPPRKHWDRSRPRHSLWQLTTRPPRSRSGSQLPVKDRGVIFVRAGRTAVRLGNSRTGVLW